MKRDMRDPLEAGLLYAIRRKQDCRQAPLNVPIIRSEVLGASSPCQMMLKRWRRKLGHLRVEYSVDTSSAVRFSQLRDRLPKQTESRDPCLRYRERSGTRYTSAIASSTTVTIVYKDLETRPNQIRLPSYLSYISTSHCLAHGCRHPEPLWPTAPRPAKNVLRHALQRVVSVL